MNKAIIKASEDSPYQTMFQESCPVFQSSYTKHVYDIILDENIREPAYYRQALQTFKQANEGDLIRITLNNGGGRIDTALMFLHGIEETQAEVLAILEGDTHSASSMIALSCHGVEVKPFASMMVHHASFGTYNTVQNVMDHVNFTSKQTEALIRKVYKYFLTEIEIEEVIRNREIWLTHEEIGDRLDIMFEAKAKEPCDCGNPLCGKPPQDEEDFGDIEEFDLEELIAQKVQEALAATQKPEKKATRTKAVKPVEKVE
jgi:ATP-dependent protease ClpP protease subunit